MSELRELQRNKDVLCEAHRRVDKVTRVTHLDVVMMECLNIIAKHDQLSPPDANDIAISIIESFFGTKHRLFIGMVSDDCLIGDELLDFLIRNVTFEDCTEKLSRRMLADAVNVMHHCVKQTWYRDRVERLFSGWWRQYVEKYAVFGLLKAHCGMDNTSSGDSDLFAEASTWPNRERDEENVVETIIAELKGIEDDEATSTYIETHELLEQGHVNGMLTADMLDRAEQFAKQKLMHLDAFPLLKMVKAVEYSGLAHHVTTKCPHIMKMFEKRGVEVDTTPRECNLRDEMIAHTLALMKEHE